MMSICLEHLDYELRFYLLAFLKAVLIKKKKKPCHQTTSSCYVLTLASDHTTERFIAIADAVVN